VKITESASQKVGYEEAVVRGRPRSPSQAALMRWTHTLPALLLSVYLFVLLARFAYRGGLFLSFFEDDYFYYFVVAKNLVLHGVSTFDGIRPTNGYHPLWLLANMLLYRVFGDHKSFFVALVLLVWLLVCATYRIYRSAQNSLHVADGYGLACALFSVTFMAVLSRTGMEVSLTLFFLALFWQRMAAQPLEEQTPRSAMLSGLLASGVILGRIDALMVVVVYVALMLYKPTGMRKTSLRNLLYFSIGLLPVVAYFAINHFEFGILLPISGIAKNLKENLVPSASTAKSLLALRSVNILLTWPACALGLLFIWHLMRRSAEDDSSHTGGRRVQLCVLLHPILFYGILSITSDWQIWSWYLYPLVPIAAFLGPVVLADWKRLQGEKVVHGLTAAICCVSVLTLVGMLRSNPTEILLYQQAVELQTFSAAHPGRYAMGGGSGVPAYLMSTPLVQLEGLMGDPPFLERIKQKEPLVRALGELQVDYYATMLLRGDHPSPGPCFDVREPEMAGFQSPVMAGHLCKPVADFSHPGGHHLLIFDVHTLTPPN
jgi:hypothetical protein